MTPTGPTEERETIILWNEKDNTATIWTASGTINRRLRKYGWVPTEEGERHAVFTIPKDRVRLPRPGKPGPKSSTRGFASRKPPIRKSKPTD